LIQERHWIYKQESGRQNRPNKNENIYAVENSDARPSKNIFKGRSKVIAYIRFSLMVLPAQAYHGMPPGHGGK
jgi:hypothetical protein